MKQFIAFVKKEFYHIFRDRITMLILLGMPVSQILIFGFAINMEVTDITVAVLNPSPDTYTNQIVERIDANNYFHVDYFIHSQNEIDDLFKQNKIDLAMVFPSNFNDDFIQSGKTEIQLISDTSDPNTGTIIVNYATNIIIDFQKEINNISHVPYQINTNTRMLYNPEMKSSYSFVPGVMGLILMVISTMMTSISIVREKERGTMEVLLASPLKLSHILIAKTIPYLSLSVINLLTILFLSHYLLEVPIQGNLLLIIIVSTLYIFLSLLLGLLISTITKKQVEAIIISGIGLTMPVMLLSGMIFPIENMPFILGKLTHIVPAKWYVIIIKKLMIEGLNFSSIIMELAILLGMTGLILILSLLNTKKRLE
ncbi:MAG: ABC transporter permease [Candidatus Saccharimonadaceae bacterium]